MPDTRPDPPPAPVTRGRTAVTVLALLSLLAITVGVMWWAWIEIGEAQFSVHGLIALGLGIGLTLACGAVLMGLIFYSSRRGYDERAHQWSRDRGRPDGPG